MRILLIQPAKAERTLGGEDVFIFEPLSLEYVAAGVSRDHDVKILDMRLDKDLQTVLHSFNPDIVGITSYTVHVKTVRRLFETIKGWNPRVLTVVGGHHATVVPEDFMSSHIDVVVAGEGVFAFRDIVARHEKGEGFRGIPGVVISKSEWQSRPDIPSLVDLDELPFPDRRLTVSYRSQYYSEWMKPLASIRTSKGCPFRCNFCALWKLTGGHYLKRSPERIVEELAGIEEEFVFFADDESLVDAPRMKELARLIEEAGIKKRYFLYGRSDTIVRNPDLLKDWKKIGLERVFVGFEFFRDEDLQYINKRASVEENLKAVQILKSLGIGIYGSLIIRPEFTRDDFRALKEFCHRLELDFSSFSVLTPLPGTDLYAEVRSQMITHDYDYFDFLHTLLPTKLPVQEFYRELSWLYRNALSFWQMIAFFRKYPLGEIPGLFSKMNRFTSRLKSAYQDYECIGG